MIAKPVSSVRVGVAIINNQHCHVPVLFVLQQKVNLVRRFGFDFCILFESNTDLQESSCNLLVEFRFTLDLSFFDEPLTCLENVRWYGLGENCGHVATLHTSLDHLIDLVEHHKVLRQKW